MIPSSIACSGNGECAAVGTYINPLQNSLGLLLNETGGQWAGGTGAHPARQRGAGQHRRRSDRGARIGRLPAGGRVHRRGLVLRQRRERPGPARHPDGNAWQPGAEVTLPANAVSGLEKQSAGLDWISCASVGNCLATGVYTDIGYNSQGLLLSEVNGVWQTGRRVAAAAQRQHGRSTRPPTSPTARTSATAP